MKKTIALLQGRRFRRPFLFAATLVVAACATSSITPPAPVQQLDATFDPVVLRKIDATIEQGIADKRMPGAVFWLERNGVSYHRAYGQRSLQPAVEPMSEDTIFDAASVTKVVATAPSVWLLIQQGKIGLDDPLAKYIPEFAAAVPSTDYGAPQTDAPAEWRHEVTIRHLLTHTSGLRPDITLTQRFQGFDETWKRILAEPLLQRPGAIFRYSDINYELLGEVVHRVSGQPLNVFVEQNVFQPLGMTDSHFYPCVEESVAGQPAPVCRANVPPDVLARIAPTELYEGEGILRGVVHDPTARRMGGVAGHAGLFTTAKDLAAFARALLNGGGKVFTPEIVKAMTSVQSPKGAAIRRAGGMDIDSGFSRPRGDLFPIGSYGHTGWTGNIIWIDPYSKTFYVFVSNRVHPNGKGNVVPLYRTLGTLSAQAVRGFDFSSVPDALPKRAGGGVRFTGGAGDAQNGIDVLSAERYAPLRGMRVGLITNHTGIDKTGNPTIDLLRSAPGVQLVSLFSPEHGIRGVADEKVGDSVDEVTGLPIYSLYGDRRKPSPEQLANLDALVYDIQDVGVRFYTYESTMEMAEEAVSGSKVKLFVLDRINPINGVTIEGPVLEGAPDFVAYHTVPIRHGMTLGELARMYAAEKNLTVDLNVVPLKGWKREMWQDQSGVPWINTSPNMRSLTEAALYPGIGLLESALSVGRGTPTPFELAGAPYIDENKLAAELTAMHLAGIAFTPVRFTPDYSVHKGESCGGVRMTITDRDALRPVDVGIAIATLLYRDFPAQFPVEKMTRLLRHPATLEAIKAGKSLAEIQALWANDFAARRAKYLMY